MNTPPPKKYKILLVGDDCIDVYRYGHVSRISPEAPVPVFEFDHEESRPGMAANVMSNLLALGCDVDFFRHHTSRKIRLIDQRSGQHVLRIDEDRVSPAMIIDTQLNGVYDAIVVSDYNKGTVDYDTVAGLRKEFAGPIFIDTKKKDLHKFNGCIVKINEKEYNECLSLADCAIVTMGAAGAQLFIDRRVSGHFDAEAVPVVDVCGAGDTFLAALTYCYLSTRALEPAIEFAVRAGTVTVTHAGVYAPTLEEINATTR